jgi:exodeoxyribonuclease VII large subunit
MAVPVRVDLLRQTMDLGTRIDASMLRRTEVARQRLRDLGRSLPSGDRLFEIPRQRLDATSGRLGGGLALNVQRYAGRLGKAVAKLTPQPLLQTVARHTQRVAELSARSLNGFQRRMRDRQTMLSNAGKMLETLSHRATLARGFALVRDDRGHLIRQRVGLNPGQSVHISFTDGDIAAQIDGDGKHKPKSGPKPPAKSQGDLF